MPYSPERIAKIHQKEAATPDALKRDAAVDYYHGWFFVTLNTRAEVPVLSWCEGDVAAPDGAANAPRCVYTEVGEGVLGAWKRNDEVYPDVEVDMAEAMPDHFHGLIHLLPGNKKHLGQIIKGFMIGCSHAYWDTLGIPWRDMGYVKGVRTPQYEDRDHTRSYRGPALFVHGYNDTEPITEAEIEIKRAYIRDQARKRLIQGDRHTCFIKHRHQHTRSWTVSVCMQAVVTDRCFRDYGVRQEAAMLNVLARLNKDVGTTGVATPSVGTTGVGAPAAPAPPLAIACVVTLPSGRQVQMPGIGLDYIGNQSLLFSQQKLPLVCHSADASRFEEQKAAVLDAARRGSVIVSAFISPRERDIKEQLMVELLPFIEILDNGLSDKYKGVGKAFYALAENRLCQITPWAYLYEKDAKVTRELCLVMNELARVISGQRDDWWKGLNPAADI